MHDQGDLNLQWSEQLIRGLAESGVIRAVISPGARSTPLVLACERAPGIQTEVVNDERSAAFYALGMAKQNRRATILIGTSGSAAAHWYPAVIEAYHSGIPLILLSADRPPELHDWGFNQTTDQQRLFGTHVRAFYDPGPPSIGVSGQFMEALGRKAAHQALGTAPGPVHINLPFREPLVPAQLPPPPSLIPSPALPESRIPVLDETVTGVVQLISEVPGAIVCGPAQQHSEFPAAVTELARILRAPLFADPLSGLRFGIHDKSRVLSHYDTFLRNPDRPEAPIPKWILRFGAPPVSKALNSYIQTSRAKTILVSQKDPWPDPDGRASAVLNCDPTLFCQALAERTDIAGGSEGLLAHLLSRDDAASSLLGEGRPPLEAEIIRRALDVLPERGTLFCSNSLPIRQVDAWSGTGNKPILIAGNRGVSGIDGNLSTLYGMASAGGQPLIGLIGDQAFFHDINGLLLSQRSGAVIIVLNNGGGRIFDQMPLTNLPEFRKYWTAPVNLDIEAAAGLFGCRFRRARDANEFAAALPELLNFSGGGVLEVTIDPAKSLADHRSFLERSAGC